MIRANQLSLSEAEARRLHSRFPDAFVGGSECVAHGKYADPAGHARASVSSKIVMLHRAIYAATHLEGVPADVLVLHRCGNASCINYSHLYLGDAKQNMRDRSEHGRGIEGVRNPHAKLTFEMVEQVKLATGRQIDIAKQFGISQAQVSKIKLGQSWGKIY